MVRICNTEYPKDKKIDIGVDFELDHFQKYAIEGIQNNKNILITAHTGSGKCHSKDTPILMYDGTIKLVQNIKENELLMGDDSKPRKVLGLARGIETMYKVKLSNGDIFGCNESHILCLKYNVKPFMKIDKRRDSYPIQWFDNENIKMRNTSFKYNEKNKEDVFEEATQFLNDKIKEHKSEFTISVKDYFKLSKYLQRNTLSYKVGVEFPEKQVDLDPYFIGLWLGDGHSNRGNTITNQDATILKYLVNKVGDYDCYLKFIGGYDYRFNTLKKNTGGNGSWNYIIEKLKKYNLQNNKHIPYDYKCNSRENRLKLLAGLIDSDGYYHYKGYEITQKNTILSNDIVYLARSLGFACNIKKVKKSCMYKGKKKEGEYNKMNIFGDNLHELPILCERKKCKEKRLINKPALDYFFNIEQVGIGNYYGFELDGNHKYLLGNFIVCLLYTSPSPRD